MDREKDKLRQKNNVVFYFKNDIKNSSEQNRIVVNKKNQEIERKNRKLSEIFRAVNILKCEKSNRTTFVIGSSSWGISNSE